MKKKSNSPSLARRPLSRSPLAAGFALALLPFLVSNAQAFQFDLGEASGSLDTTLSYGTGWRVEGQDKAFQRNFFKTWSNKNDGTGHFENDADPIASTFKITSDFELKYQDFGFLARGTAFYDTVIMDERPEGVATPNNSDCNPQVSANPLNCGFAREIDDKAGSRARLLDAYVYGNFDVAGRDLNVRLGNQVINWGEALFLQDGINSANPVSLSQLRLPGAEVKEALLPLPMLYASLQLSDALSAEAFYQFDWDFSEADAVGTYYSTDDALSGFGAQRVLADTTGTALGAPQAALGGASVTQFYNQSMGNQASNTLTYKKAGDVSPGEDGQFGVALRYLAESLNNTEFGFFFMNYHAHKPVAQATAGQAFFCQNSDIAKTPQQQAACGTALAQGLNAAHYVNTTTYQLVYPENINMYGLSFSTMAGGLSISGEVAYRPNEAILTEFADNLVFANSAIAGLMGNLPGAEFDIGEHIKGAKPGQSFKLYDEVETVNASLVVINDFGPSIGFDGLLGLMEFGVNHVANFDSSKDYAAPGSMLNVKRSDLPAGALGSCPTASSWPDAEACVSEGPRNDYMDATSMGYRVVLQGTLNNLFAGVVVTPVIRFAHDVKGNSHRTGNFLENRKSATLAVNAVYSNAFDVGFAYNTFWGAERSNLIHDRDNVTVAVKYSF